MIVVTYKSKSFLGIVAILWYVLGIALGVILHKFFSPPDFALILYSSYSSYIMGYYDVFCWSMVVADFLLLPVLFLYFYRLFDSVVFNGWGWWAVVAYILLLPVFMEAALALSGFHSRGAGRGDVRLLMMQLLGWPGAVLVNIIAMDIFAFLLVLILKCTRNIKVF